MLVIVTFFVGAKVVFLFLTDSTTLFPKSKNKDQKNKWNVGFGFSIKEETSRGDKIPFSKISFIEDDNVKILDNKNVTKVEVSEIKNFSFDGEIDLEKIVGDQDPKNIAINFFTNN